MIASNATMIERSAASKSGSPWFVIDTVHDQTSGDVLFVQAVLATDDPLFQFHNPADYPRLSSSVVEAANKRYRKAHRVYYRTMLQYKPDYWDALFAEEESAFKRMAVHRHQPWETGGILIAGIGGYIVDDLPPLSGDAQIDWIGESVVDLVRLRKAKDYETADALRREIVIGAGVHIFMTKDGIEFINAEDWRSHKRSISKNGIAVINPAA